MNGRTPANEAPQKHSRRFLEVVNRHRLKLLALLVALALMMLLADAVLKGSAY